MSRYERVVFFQIGDEADEILNIIDDDGPEAAIEYAAQWHYPGEHETAAEMGHGSADNVFHSDDGYILSWNTGLGYAGLEFDSDFEGD